MISVKVLGPGCIKCNKLFELTQKAIESSGVAANLVKVTGLDDIVGYGVMMTPALVINEEVKSTGNVPKPDQIVSWLTQAEKA